ncbi:inorganic pyrophosphatase [Wolbachia endosymbiont of Culex quinquefasciatus JHB]|uniref:inorganic diphosphatase n=1 Tax=Wolbachia TaxID=953 RepID=UPI0001761F0B|nr:MULTISPECIES: inorganic diphosphatase [Wolbachia]EEB56195.1 inorganic pyrophosphatase [Wolbachia endosymbiont of Culex quinquefasciatus JHB]CAQ54910.1 inorganic pyrophosphatase [Wolbachia endosymbiont of Culex quinquefasciatus Pel]CQD09320.1 inorganic pyrophosphatase [Wolbachia endosymbiont wPip_Mol of Culex molestus]
MDLSKVTTKPDEINVVIEISANAEPVKYEFNKELGLLQVDRFLSTSMTYPCNYGFIPNTCAGDGDPADVLVLTQFPLAPGVLISVRPVGALLTKDEKGEDEKILAVPISSVDSYYENIKNYSDLSKNLLDKIAHFFSHYKDLEKGKTVTVGEWANVEKAKKIIEKSRN